MIREITVNKEWVDTGENSVIISNPSRVHEIFVTTDNNMKTGIPIKPLESLLFNEATNLYVKGLVKANVVLNTNV